MASSSIPLVITADDFGYCRSRNDAILELYRGGAITRTSLLINASQTDHAIGEAKKTNLIVGELFLYNEKVTLLVPSEVCFTFGNIS